MAFNSFSDLSRSTRPRRDLRFESPGQMALVGIALWLIAAIVHPLAILAALGLALLLIAAVGYVLRPRSHSMYWRGRRIDLDDNRGPVEQLYRLLFRR